MPVVSRTSALICAIVAIVDTECIDATLIRASVEVRATNAHLGMRHKGLNVRNALQGMNQMQLVVSVSHARTGWQRWMEFVIAALLGQRPMISTPFV